MKIFIKKTLIIFLASTLFMTCGCTNLLKKDTTPKTNLSTTEFDLDAVPTETASPEDKIAFATSTPKNDTDLGLRNVKIDNAEAKLTDAQKLIIRYFDNDYFGIYGQDYEFLRRYPQIFDGAQIETSGTVKKILSQTTDEYQLVLWIGSEYNTKNNEYLVLKGQTGSALFMEGDLLNVRGRYLGVETFEIDGTTYTVPHISVHEARFSQSHPFDAASIKTIASSIFGENLQLRKPVIGEDVDIDTQWQVEETFVAELENQSNAKFSSYYLYTTGGYIDDATISWDSDIERQLEFAADFEHFLILTYDWAMETLTLDYYDKNLNKLWHREFLEVAPPETEGLMLTRSYDYTKNNIYFAVNNELYIINTETGEDTFPPVYVGSKKLAVRKLSDGILLIGHNKSDGVIKLNLSGSVEWRTNLVANVLEADYIQVLEDRIVICAILLEEYSSPTHYIVLNNDDGSVVIDAIHQE